MLNGLLLKFIKTLGTRNDQETIVRWSSTTKPSLGGISFFVIFLLSVTGCFVLTNQQNPLNDNKFIGLLSACTIAFIMGLADDAYNTRPLLKFLVQVLCGIILILSGIVIQVFPWMSANYFFTVLWVVGMMNSINMLDNMDGITATVSLTIIIAAIVIIALHHNFTSNYHVVLLLGMSGALVGFLFYNWHPSKMYMGDTGSQFLGIFLAAIGIMYFWNVTDSGGNMVQSKQFYVGILAFIIPICDTTTVVINRLARGQSPFIGGKDHTTHHLSYLGLSDRQVALVFAALSFLSILATIFIISYIPVWGYLHITLFGLYFIAVFGFLFGVTKITKPKNDS